MGDIVAKTLTATGAMNKGRARIKGLNFLPVATAGSIEVRDGSASGGVVLTLDVNSGSNTSVEIPGCGILTQGDPYVTLTTVTSVTFFVE